MGNVHGGSPETKHIRQSDISSSSQAHETGVAIRRGAAKLLRLSNASGHGDAGESTV